MARLLKYKGQPSAQRVMVFGPPKSGKTSLLALLAAQYKILLLDLERGKETLMAACSDSELDNIEYINIPDSPTNPIADSTLLDMWESRKGWICEQHGVWKCPLCTKLASEFFQINLDELTPENGWIICIDSGTQFGQSAFHYICNKNKVSLEDGDKASFLIWGVQGAHIEKLFGMIQAGKNHVLLIAHEIEVEMPDKSKKLVASMGTKRVASNFGKYFDHVIRLSKQAGKHKQMSLTSAINAETGSRWGLDINDPRVSILDFFVKPDWAVDQKATTGSGVTPKLGASKLATPASATPTASAAPAAKKFIPTVKPIVPASK